MKGIILVLSAAILTASLHAQASQVGLDMAHVSIEEAAEQSALLLKVARAEKPRQINTEAIPTLLEEEKTIKEQEGDDED